MIEHPKYTFPFCHKVSKRHNLNHPFEISFVSQDFKKEIEMVKSAHLSDAEFDQYVDTMYRKEEFSVDCVSFLMQPKKNLIERQS